MADLHIPDTAVQALAEYTEDVGGAWSGTAEEDIRAVAAPVVADDYRRMAARLRTSAAAMAHKLPAYCRGLDEAARKLDNRANELDPPQSGGAHR